MKKLLVTCIALVFILSGCYITEPIELEEVHTFYDFIEGQFDYINSIKMYKKSETDTLVITYESKDTVKEEDVAKCFEATRKWLLEEGHLESMQEHLGEKIQELYIQFDVKDKKEIYRASYHNLENGQYVQETQAGIFNKWYHEVIEKENK